MHQPITTQRGSFEVSFSIQQARTVTLATRIWTASTIQSSWLDVWDQILYIGFGKTGFQNQFTINHKIHYFLIRAHTRKKNQFFSPPVVFSSVDVACVGADDAPADMADCLRWEGVMPVQVRECQVPCKNECTFTSWSRFTQCQGCGSWRTRNRSLIGTTITQVG